MTIKDTHAHAALLEMATKHLMAMGRIAGISPGELVLHLPDIVASVTSQMISEDADPRELPKLPSFLAGRTFTRTVSTLACIRYQDLEEVQEFAKACLDALKKEMAEIERGFEEMVENTFKDNADIIEHIREERARKAQEEAQRAMKQ